MREKPKPIRQPKIGPRQIWRIPAEGPIIPRLQQREGVGAIGFTAKLVADDDE